MLVTAWARTYGLHYIILRPTNNYGIGQYPEKLIPVAVKNLSRGKKIGLHDKGTPIRNWLHASDTAEAVILLINKNIRDDIFNVAGGFEQPNLQTVSQILTHYFGAEVSIEDYVDLSGSRKGQDMRYALNDAKLKALGWSPVKKFDEEIKGIVDHYKENFIW